ncbi:MAG: Y-family DNA polymerase [Synergistaceae bacterium]|jgi:DNA polymerase V|nr:Y-family DNA polymerase [Synergistaceae bacterium]
MLLALCDCNNFFVSCERLYRPELRGRPVVVLSSNDGCIVSRSNEAKTMGIKMGQPYFQVETYLRQNGVVVCSGNLAMYKEISDKVMQTFERFTDTMEVYSIDEAFLRFPKNAEKNAFEYASSIRRTVDRLVGIPISIGIACTKTQAKLASEKAKKISTGVMEITGENVREILDKTAIEDIWGIGRKTAEKLRRYGIATAGAFVLQDPLWVKKELTVRGLATQYELQGRSCIPLETKVPLPKSIQVSRTWGSVLETFEDVWRAMLDNIVKAARQLRDCGLAVGAASVFLRYGKRHSGECGYFTEKLMFKEQILSDIELIAALKKLVDAIYRPGHRYTQGGVVLGAFTQAVYRQRGLFDQEDYERRAKLENVSYTVDAINENAGERVVYPASLGVKNKKWRPNRQFLTAKWSEL